MHTFTYLIPMAAALISLVSAFEAVDCKSGKGHNYGPVLNVCEEWKLKNNREFGVETHEGHAVTVYSGAGMYNRNLRETFQFQQEIVSSTRRTLVFHRNLPSLIPIQEILY